MCKITRGKIINKENEIGKNTRGDTINENKLKDYHEQALLVWKDGKDYTCKYQAQHFIIPTTFDLVTNYPKIFDVISFSPLSHEENFVVRD